MKYVSLEIAVLLEKESWIAPKCDKLQSWKLEENWFSMVHKKLKSTEKVGPNASHDMFHWNGSS